MGLAMPFPAISGAEPCTLFKFNQTSSKLIVRKVTYGSPITNESPALTDGTRPSEPTSAAAASLIEPSRF